MESKNPFYKPGNDSETSIDPLDNTSKMQEIGSPEPARVSPRSTLSDNEKVQRTIRNESTATAVEDNRTTTRLEPMDKVETADKSIDHDSDDNSDGHHNSHVANTVKKATHAAKRKMYIHHRHDRRLSMQYTPGSMSKHMGHLGFLRTHGSKGQKAKPEDLEANGEDESVSPSVWQNFRIMFTTFPYWNMAFWSGWCYSIGSALFIIDGAWAWVPLRWPETEFEGQSKYGVPLLFFFGACLYQVGGVMAYLEAINDGSFAGAAMKRLLDGHQDIEKELLDAKLHTFFGHIVPHHHHDDEEEEDRPHGQQHALDNSVTKWDSVKKNDPEEVYAEAKGEVERRGGVDEGPTEEGKVREYIAWRWWPTWHALKTYHIYELGYVACTIQLFGVTLYGVTSIVILPGILDSLEWWQKIASYWVPQVVASCCFLIASIMFTIMAQDNWYKPKPNAVSWWIGIWAQLGSVGFTLCAIFGFFSEEHEWGEFQSSLSSFWGSFFYMTSGLFQWYEAINVNVGPVLAFPNNRTPVLLRRHPN